MGALIGVLVVIGIICLLSMLLPHVLRSIPSLIGIIIVAIILLVIVGIVFAVVSGLQS